jgi:hypothetical protein
MALPSTARHDDHCALQYKGRTKEFDLVSVRANRTLARPATLGDVRAAVATVGDAIKGVHTAAPQVVGRVVMQNPDSLWVFVRDAKFVGCVAMLMLNRKGLDALVADSIDIRDPDPRLLAPAGAEPAAIYIWALASLRHTADGIVKVIQRLRMPPFRRSDIYARPATAEGLRFLWVLCFEPISGQHNLFRYERLANRDAH